MELLTHPIVKRTAEDEKYRMPGQVWEPYTRQFDPIGKQYFGGTKSSPVLPLYLQDKFSGALYYVAHGFTDDNRTIQLVPLFDKEGKPLTKLPPDAKLFPETEISL